MVKHLLSQKSQIVIFQPKKASLLNISEKSKKKNSKDIILQIARLAARGRS